MITWTLLMATLLAVTPALPRQCALGGSLALTGVSLPMAPAQLLSCYETFHSFGAIDQLSFPLILLSCLVQFALALSTLTYPLQRALSMNSLLLALLFFIVLTFSSSSLIGFYVFFEASLIPIFLVVLTWGYQPERLKAALSLLFYTSVASLPLLLTILSLQPASFFMAACTFKAQTACWLNSWQQIFVLLAVLVKIPIFGPHQWLPKAHVEAPVEGSMVLAAVLLKLGGYGFARLFPFTTFSGGFSLSCFSLTLIGSSIISLVCLFQFDMKVLIAYSSVAHMSLVIAPLLLKSHWGATAALAVMVAHGASSSLLFAASNMLTKASGSRSIILAKGVLTSSSFFPALWFLACSANMAGPFTFNLVAELESIVALVKASFSTLLPFGLMMFMAAAYSLSLYALTQHSAAPGAGLLFPAFSKVDLLTLSFHLFFVFSLALAAPLLCYP